MWWYNNCTMKNVLSHVPQNPSADIDQKSFTIFQSIMNSIEESVKQGDKIELVPFRKWQQERGLSMSVNSSEFRPNIH